jgi:hypothetical protein
MNLRLNRKKDYNMMKGILLLSLTFLSLTAFANPADRVPTGHLKVVPGTLYGFKKYPKELALIQKSFPIMEAVVNSEEFKRLVIGYRGSDGKGYTSNRGMSNEQVYTFLMKGKELIGGDSTLGEMNFNVERYSRWWSKVIAYTSPGNHDWIMVNGKFYSKFDEIAIASNLVHEWTHLTGFLHDSARDHDSVPYAVGYIVEKLAEKYLEQGFLD